MSDTKAKFMEGYRKPIASIYATVMNELIVQQHFIRYSINYEYNPVSQGRTRLKAWMDPFQILRFCPAFCFRSPCSEYLQLRLGLKT